MGLAMLELGKIDNVMVLTADLAKTSGLDRFKATFPYKFLNMGIAEQHMIGFGAGLAKEGYLVYATTFANFAAMRSYEQIRLNLGYMGFNVKVLGIASGLAMAMFGNTHYGIEDIALMRAVPNLTVVSPADGAEVVKTMFASAVYPGPMYIRLTGSGMNPVVYAEDYEFEIGKAITLKDGSDVSMIATGSMVHTALVAADILDSYGIKASVIDMHTIKPLDTNVINNACKTGLIVTVEEHSVIGGLGAAVAEYTATLSHNPKQLFIGLPDSFIKSGSYEFMIDKHGLTAEKIAERIRRELSKE
jgi:transketolase